MEYYAHEYNTIEQFQNEFCGAENTTCKPKRLQLNITIETRESNNNNNNKRIPKKQQNKIKKQQQQQQLTCKITFIFLYFSFSFISFFEIFFLFRFGFVVVPTVTDIGLSRIKHTKYTIHQRFTMNVC